MSSIRMDSRRTADYYRQDRKVRKEQFTPEQYELCRMKVTEVPFTGNYCDYKEEDDYYCMVCGNAPFNSKTKFDSGTTWPNFIAPVKLLNLKFLVDHSSRMTRIEVQHNNSGAHLNYIFDDGSDTTGIRYCLSILHRCNNLKEGKALIRVITMTYN
jgi:peptide-methionine (R)-S-oxide reductase